MTIEICPSCNSPQLVLPDGTHACLYTKSLLAFHESIINRKWEAAFAEHTDNPPLDPVMALSFIEGLYDEIYDQKSIISDLKWDLIQAEKEE